MEWNVGRGRCHPYYLLLANIFTTVKIRWWTEWRTFASQIYRSQARGPRRSPSPCPGWPAIIALIQLTISIARLNLYLTNKCDIFNNNIFSKAQLGNIDPLHPAPFSSSKPDGVQGAVQLWRLHRHPRHLHIRRLHYIFSCQVILSRLKDKDIGDNKDNANG